MVARRGTETPGNWSGHYLDGRTAARRPVGIRVMRTGLELTLEDGGTVWWPYAEIRQTQGAYAGEQVRLERGPEPSEALLVADAMFLAAMRRVAPEVTAHFHDPRRRQLRVQLTVAAGLAVVGITIALYLWGIPAMARAAAARVPASWEELLGRAIAQELAPPAERCAKAPHADAIEAVTKAVTAPFADSPYTVRVLVADQGTVNALALPGGYIVVFRGLLEETARAEALAGVLAHEVQHVVRRHATRALLEHASTGLLVAALTGDVSGVLAFGLEGARTMGVLRYSRRHEEEADAAGAQLLVAAGIDPTGMIEFFESLRDRHGKTPSVLRYLSTHPRPAERIERLRRLVAGSPRPSGRLLPAYDWQEIAKVCPSSARRAPSPSPPKGAGGRGAPSP